MMIAQNSNRVREQTEPDITERLDRQCRIRVDYFRDHRDQIDRRLRELDEEWDIERMLAANSSALTMTGLVMSIVGSRKWLLLSMTVQAFYMQHTLQGWCPPLPILRRLGFRTAGEIEAERHALKRILEE
jgi:hypothetical protein